MSVSSSDNTESISNDDSSDSIAGCSTDSSCERRELLPLYKGKSGVWDYFGFPAKNGDFTEKDKKKRREVYCKLCPKKINYQGNTTNMIAHLQYNHHAEFLKVKAKVSNSTQA